MIIFVKQNKNNKAMNKYDYNEGEDFHTNPDDIIEEEHCDFCNNEISHYLNNFALCEKCYKEELKHTLMDFSYDLRIKSRK
jgi:hypothetical protein